MKQLLYLLTFFITSCQLTTNQTIAKEQPDTLQTSTIPEVITQDTSKIILEKTNDTIFLGFRIGMTRSEFERHKQILIRNKKLKFTGNVLTYQINVDENEGFSIFASKEDDIPKKIWTGNGTLVPEFLDEKLISITLKFLGTKGSNVYSFFQTNLNNKYYSSPPDANNFFDNNKKVDTLQAGNFVRWFITNKWTIDDINISLRFNHETFMLPDKNAKVTDDVVLKYWSEYYNKLKRDKKANEESKERNKVQSDF